MLASASIKKPVQLPANREERNKDYVHIKASSINQTCRCCEAMTFGAYGQGRIQYIVRRHKPPPARHTVGKGGRGQRCGPWRDERQTTAESRGADALHHRPAETNQ